MDKDRPIINYICRECKKTFKAPQGSRRELCPICLSLAMAKELPKDKVRD